MKDILGYDFLGGGSDAEMDQEDSCCDPEEDDSSYCFTSRLRVVENLLSIYKTAVKLRESIKERCFSHSVVHKFTRPGGKN